LSITYKLEVWGASSGKLLLQNVIKNQYGRGGYSYGTYSISKNQSLYIAVGGKGQDGKYQARVSGGWNGGGAGEWDHCDDEANGGGGGCTSIQTSKRSDGQLKNYESVKNTEVLIVAGGGGGANHRNDNPYGGGEKGGFSINFINDATGIEQKQATQTSGYAFGIGQSAPTTFDGYSNMEMPGGGGGWYGGYTTTTSWGSAGGGSGHIGTMLTNGATIAGNQTIPSPSGGTETGHSGNGYCKITWMPVL
jgi:hypothetical protein